MTKSKKGFNTGLYGVIAGVLVAAILVGMTVFAFTTRYNAFSPEKVAQSYADTVVQTGDGYNALKVSLVSKNQKFGNFVINAYIAPYVNDNSGKKKGEKKIEQNKEIGTGSKKEAKLLDTVYNTMYDFKIMTSSTASILQNSKRSEWLFFKTIIWTQTLCSACLSPMFRPMQTS